MLVLYIKQNKEEECNFICYNVIINGKRVYNARLIHAGLWIVNDLYDGRPPLPFHIWLSRGVKQCDFMI